MRTNRRNLLKSGAVLGAVAGVPLAMQNRKVASLPVLVIHDSGIHESRTFARQQKAAQVLDVADADPARWAMLRADLPQDMRLEGLTRWSGWVTIRSELEARGWRVLSEQRTPAPYSGREHLIRWSMAARQA